MARLKAKDEHMQQKKRTAGDQYVPPPPGLPAEATAKGPGQRFRSPGFSHDMAQELCHSCSCYKLPYFFPFSDVSCHVLPCYLIYLPIQRYEDTPIQVDNRHAMETGRPLSIYPSC
jgi:hypothetical protein